MSSKFFQQLFFWGFVYLSIPMFSCAQNQPMTMAELPLSWNDYPHKNIHDTHAFEARTSVSYGASYEYKIGKDKKEVQLKLSFYIHMDKEHSYVKKSFLKMADSVQSRQLLNHEIGHWILSMIYYHQLVQDLEHFPFDYRVKQQMDSILLKNRAQCRTEQLQYDAATNHSKNALEQEQWEKELLDRLYKTYGKVPVFPEDSTINRTISW